MIALKAARNMVFLQSEPESIPPRIPIPCSRITSVFCCADLIQVTRWSLDHYSPFEPDSFDIVNSYVALWVFRKESTDMA